MGMPGGAQGRWRMRYSGRAKSGQILVPFGWKWGEELRVRRGKCQGMGWEGSLPALFRFLSSESAHFSWRSLAIIAMAIIVLQVTHQGNLSVSKGLSTLPRRSQNTNFPVETSSLPPSEFSSHSQEEGNKAKDWACHKVCNTSGKNPKENFGQPNTVLGFSPLLLLTDHAVTSLPKL